MAGFRGATRPVELSFDTTKPVALVFGENGTGKSTIADALDFVCNRHFGSLEDRSMSAHPKSHVTSLGQDPKKLKVLVATSVGSFTAALTKDGPVVTPTAGCPEARILRRSNILQLLDAQPKQRFEALKTFIAVPGIEKSENALREAARSAKDSFDEAVRAYTQANAALEDFWAAEGKPGKTALEWAAAEVAKDLSALEKAVKQTGHISTALQNVETALSSLDRGITELTEAKTAQTKAEEEQKKVEAKQSQQNVALVRLLQDAKSYVAARKPMPHCPVCEQGIDAENLVTRLESRISEMNELSTTANALTTAKRSVEGKQSVVDQSRKDFCQKAKVLGILLKGCSFEEVTELKIQWTDYDDLLSHTEPSDALETKARELVLAGQSCYQPLAERKRNDQKSIDQKNAIKGHLDTHVEKLKTAASFQVLARKLNSALEVVSQQRKAYVEGVLAAICDEVERLFTKLHPGEGIGKVRFYLKPSAIGSLEFDAQFQTETEVPPQAYYSESHLDTLGICVFLALAKHFMTDNTIVVLDDVVTSVDGPHLDRFMDLLHEEAPAFNQVIVTTHYRPWKDRYRYARGPVAKTQVIELRAWSIANGVQTDEAVTAVAELNAAVANPKLDRQSVASKAGIQLESILDFLTYQYRSKMPRQTDPNYTLGDLAAGIDSKLGKVLRVLKPGAPGQPKSEVLLKPIIDETTAQTWVRNRAGCHFHSLGSDIPDNEIKDFGSKVVALADMIICAKCQCFPTRRPTGSFWQCECGDVELYPLIPPGTPVGSVTHEE
ncbi:MAG: AAA family ATPase [Chloroflexi bacterium]|nr:AAA family ATPase [Chloroflexota bacterium]